MRCTMVADRQKFIGEFYGSFFAWVNIAGLILQSFFVSRIFKAIGPGRALFIGPGHRADRLLRDSGRAGPGIGPGFEDPR